MRKRQLAALALAALLVAALAGIWILAGTKTSQESVEAELTITAFAVGKADAVLLQTSDAAALVDTGEESDGEFLVQELKERGVEHLDLLLVTHFDKDHVGSAAYIVENMDVEAVLMPDYEGTRPEYEAFLESLEGHPDVTRLTQVIQLKTGSLSWTVYPAEDVEEILDTDGEYDNDLSLVASVSYGEKKFLLTGDIEKTRIAQMLDSGVDWRHDWIKMPHHGRYQKALKELLDAVQPQTAVICCSEEEYAEDKTLELLKGREIETWDTSTGAVVTVCDGEQIATYQGK